MWQFLFGFGTGVYVGSFYDCKPYIKRAIECAKTLKPEERNDKEEKNNK